MRIINCYNDAMIIREELAMCQLNGCHLLFRGHASSHFKLLSTLGRKRSLNGDLLDSENKCFEDYKKIVVSNSWLKYKIKPYNTDLFCMSIGRHMGLDCRLLDWTSSIDTALYFVISDKYFASKNGHLWIMIFKGEVNDLNASKSPFKVESLTLIKENYLQAGNEMLNNQPLGIVRRFAQNGFFTITASDKITTPLNELKTKNFIFYPIIITPEAKIDIANNLQKNDELLYLSFGKKEEKQVRVINSKYFTS